ncbi:glycine-rich cell wall structural protein 1.8-like, partial [Amphibalanus amphitrite]|uniref:glycine-rich cell wall structural protein 1.8-like n=1 Tax=Amphibalanus amphitrite TaxID=1232801 RepID=UPI001C910A59
EPASGRQYGDGHSQSYGTSWNNHYQSPTKGSSYDSRYDAPEKGDSNRYNDEGHHQYNHKGGDSDSVSYHSETPYGGGHYSGGTYHSGGGNYHGDGRNNYRGGDDHYGGGGGRYDGGGNNYDDGYNYGGGDGYGGSRNHDGGRNHNDDITSYTTGDSHYNGGGDGRNDYDGDDHGYGGGRNHYEGDENHYGGGGNNYGYGGDSHGDDYGRGHGGYSGHDEYGHGSHDEYGHGSDGGYDHGGHGGGYGGPGRGSNGHSEDPIDEYAVYSPKMSGTYRRRSDPGQGGHHRGSLRRPVSEGNTFRYGVAKPPGVDRKDDFEDFSSGGKASTIGEVRRNDIQVSPGFKPGVLEHGFLPILPPKHHISRRSLSDEAAKSDYQPYYSNYKGRHGYRNYKTQQDPYQRYLPREDENDPYFR